MDDVLYAARPDDSRGLPNCGVPVSGNEMVEGKLVPAERRGDQALVGPSLPGAQDVIPI